ncbi:MAG: bifunctional (p)ppGpp synthetase/guanosine-3',5'-bis(diphosphate) 3'-pyrophosphohydrolase [Gloeomargaritaceae cyanobacterium C42_A2020_066]|nr:bifunctional (p)ppGpp synthetase/guanosine-3',5'-bis(diphosphate) 3'-pyrophosphohydrolase [Gloeomargaritaceae cyanobacterium C42_A2020_066]
MDAAPDPPTDLPIPNWLQAYFNRLDPEIVVSEETRREALLVTGAFQFAHQLHQGQKRKSGEPYIIHPLAVSGILADLGASGPVLAAGLLHDVLEDTPTPGEELENRFGAEVRRLVEGVTKLSKFNFASRNERQAESFRRMFISMAQDIRVIIVKLADRLHNMRTLEFMPPAGQQRTALETREIFAPLANRLGIWHLKWELEDLAFKYLEPDAYRHMQELVAEKRTDREDQLDVATRQIRQEIAAASITCQDISSRPKHLYSIWRKMQQQHKEFHEIQDLAAVRIIVFTLQECYATLAVVHNLFRPIPGRFKDYIGLPKPNNYQSLHTVVIGTSGRPLEIQIRTLEMHQVAEYGIAAHWKYKETSKGTSSRVEGTDQKFTWLRQLVEWQNDLKDAQEFLDNVKDDLKRDFFDQEVYTFTPDGDVIDLPRGATPVDFAYRVHTEVGNRCHGAKVNGRLVPLNTQLRSGDIVEILTQKAGRPSLGWLDFVGTSTARNRIRQWYKRKDREEHIKQGRALLETALGREGLESLLRSDVMKAVAERCNYRTVDDLLAALGFGDVTVGQVVARWQEAVRQQQPADLPIPEPVAPSPSPVGNGAPAGLSSLRDLMHRRANCCSPVPGEPIVGVVTMGSHGITIHHQSCPNLANVPPERLLPVDWDPVDDRQAKPATYPVDVKVKVIERVGVLKDVLQRISDNQINVRAVQLAHRVDQTVDIDLTVDISHVKQLRATFDRVRQMSDVLHVRRLGLEGADLAS